MSTNASASVSGLQLLLEAFLYTLGIFLFTKFLFNLKQHVKHSNNNGAGQQSDYVRNFMTQFVLSVFCFTAPTLMGGIRATIFGTDAVTSVAAPTVSFHQ
jgi:hypothetical protein